MHSFRQTDRTSKHDTSTWGEFIFFSFLFVTTNFPSTLNWTFKVPRASWLGREALGLHKSRCTYREPSVDTVVGEVMRQVAIQEFVHFFEIIFKYDNMTEDLLRRQSIPMVLQFSCETNEKKRLKWR